MGFAGGMRRRLASFLPIIALAVSIGSGARARDSLGIFEHWGAFRDAATPRCYAIAQPVVPPGTARRGFAAIGTWPRAGVRGQFHVRLSRSRGGRAPVLLTVGDRRFTLVAGQVDAWAADPAMDAQVIAAIRSSGSMAVASVDAGGRAFADSYALRGAATAIDAAALGCARMR